MTIALRKHLPDRRRRTVVGAFSAAFFLLGLWTPASADVLFSYGYSPRGMAMGNAFVAGTDDFSAPYYNPAGMAYAAHSMTGFGYLVTGDTLNTMYADNSWDLDRTRGLMIGSVIPLGFGSFLTRRIAFGFASFFPNGVVLAIKVPYPTDPQYVNYQNAGRSLSIIGTLSVRIVDGLAVGGGAQLFDNTSGKVQATLDPAGRIDATTGQELTTSYAPTAGVMVRPGVWSPALDGLSFGAIFREKFFTRYRIPVNSYLGGVPMRVDLHATSLYQPRQYIAGISYAKPETFLVEADAAYDQWSDFPDPNLAVAVDFHIPLIPAEFKNSKSFDPNFHDTVSLRTGGEMKVLTADRLGLWLRAGYAYEPSPVPAQTRETNYLDADRHVMSFGTGLNLAPESEGRPSAVLDLVFQYQQLERRMTWKNESVDQSNPGYPKIGVEGGLWAFGVSFSTAFDYK